jgi:hypothetical protein
MADFTLFIAARRDPDSELAATAAMFCHESGYSCAIATYLGLRGRALLQAVSIEGLGLLTSPGSITIYVGAPSIVLALRKARDSSLLAPYSDRRPIRIRLARQARHKEALARCDAFIRDEIERARPRIERYRALSRAGTHRHSAAKAEWPVRFKTRRPGPQRIGELIDSIRGLLHP